MHAQKFPALLLFIAAMICTTASFARQSGSRSAAPSPGVGSNFSDQAPSLASPAQSFSTPQNFSSSSPGQISGGFNQNRVPSQNGNGQFSVSPMANDSMMATNASASSDRSSSSPGIQQSSLVDPVFEINDPNSLHVVDHFAWDHFLSRYLVTDQRGVNRIQYRYVSCEDRNALTGYLNYLQSLDVRTLNRNEQLAYWFNLYNARTVSLVIENYPIRSIRQIKEKFTDFVGPFDDEGAVNVLGKSLSLNDIESGIIRPVWNDPRIHYALNCASYGCPNLSPTAWTGQNLEARLNGAAYEYINSNRAVKRGLFGPRVSKIYKWYSGDFGSDDQGVLNHIGQFAEGATRNKIRGRQKIGSYFYDWSLNDAKHRRPRFLEALRR